MAYVNPYKNPIDDVIQSIHEPTDQFLNRNIKDKTLRKLITDLMEVRCHLAFNNGRKQGRYEHAVELKQLLDVENPNFENAQED
jgi:hypothetical protein